MMIVALTLLLVALGFVLYHDRDFWFPDTSEALEPEVQPQPSASAPVAPAQARTMVAKASSADSPRRRAVAAKTQAKESSPPTPSPSAVVDPPVNATAERTVLPPLEVEVVAGDVHRAVHPGSNSVRVDLQPGSAPQNIADASNSSSQPEAAAGLTKASEYVDMSADASEIISHPVRPGYPLLARQMRVQGSVILQALISRDGAIQDLHVMSGPPILAGAAREAVKQWRFKPHYLGAETVETQARITVNFTISTN